MPIECPTCCQQTDKVLTCAGCGEVGCAVCAFTESSQLCDSCLDEE